MEWNHESTGPITRKMRAYLCLDEDGKVFMSITDCRPINGFDEFPIGLSKLTADASSIEAMKSEYGLILGNSGSFIEAQYELVNGDEMGLRIEYGGKQFETSLRRAMDENGNMITIGEDERASKCWIPYHGKDGNIESINKNGRSIWKTDALPFLNVFDIDVFNDDGQGSGCWAWTDEDGVAAAAENVGTAGGMNTDYKYWYNGDLMTVEWDDYGTWMTEQTKYCHHGTSLFMITGDGEAACTFTCKDGVTGSQMLMRRQPLSDKIRCPVLHKEN